MLEYHQHFGGQPKYGSRWWRWPLALRPNWLGSRSYGDGRIAVTYENVSPVLAWAMLPAVVWLCARWWRERHPGFLVLFIGFFGQWLPWVLVARATYVYHFLPAVPIGALAVAAAVDHLISKGNAWQRVLAVQYAALVVLVFAFFYPIYSYLPISHHALEMRLWLPSWR